MAQHGLSCLNMNYYCLNNVDETPEAPCALTDAK